MGTDALAIGRLLEIACDESGSEGENLIGGNTDVFAHASIHMTAQAATACIEELRKRIRSPAQEYKANHLLREKHRSTLEWLLGPSGPILGDAHVHLTDKRFFVVGTVVDLLVGQVSYATSIDRWQARPINAMATTLYREGQRAFGRERWQSFLEASNNLVRLRNPLGVRAPVDAFFRTIDDLRFASTGGRVGKIIELLAQTRKDADSFRAQLVADPTMIPALDPLIPAIVQTVVYWSDGRTPVSIVHDQHNALTEERIAQLKQSFRTPDPTNDSPGPTGHLAEITLVDSRSDARVQVADFLAGVARKIASDELNDQGDHELTALLRPYVDSFSVWGDARSWSLLGSRPQS